MTVSLAAMLDEIRSDGAADDEQVQALRQIAFADAQISAETAEAVIQADEAVRQPGPAWVAFYLDVLTDYVVRQQEPQGYVDQAKADWLIARILRDGRVHRQTELDLLVRILETAEAAPASLSAFALAQAKASLLAHAAAAGATDEDVARLQRIVFAFAGPSDICVTRQEADLLFDLNDALRGRPQPRAWRDFFVKAITNSLIAAHTVIPTTRDEELAFERSLQPHRANLGDMAAGLARVGGELVHNLPHAMEPSVDPDDIYAERNQLDEAARAAAETITAAEAAWLVGRIGRDRQLDDNETALIAYLQREAPQAGRALMALRPEPA